MAQAVWNLGDEQVCALEALKLLAREGLPFSLRGDALQERKEVQAGVGRASSKSELRSVLKIALHGGLKLGRDCIWCLESSLLPG